MEQRQDAEPAHRPAKSERKEPIPLADRRRMLHQVAKPLKPAQVFTDWAAI